MFRQLWNSDFFSSFKIVSNNFFRWVTVYTGVTKFIIYFVFKLGLVSRHLITNNSFYYLTIIYSFILYKFSSYEFVDSSTISWNWCFFGAAFEYSLRTGCLRHHPKFYDTYMSHLACGALCVKRDWFWASDWSIRYYNAPSRADLRRTACTLLDPCCVMQCWMTSRRHRDVIRLSGVPKTVNSFILSELGYDLPGTYNTHSPSKRGLFYPF